MNTRRLVSFPLLSTALLACAAGRPAGVSHPAGGSPLPVSTPEAAGGEVSEAVPAMMKTVEDGYDEPASPAAPRVARAASPAPSVAAGEWDDNANYREFQQWLRTSEGFPFHRIDVSDRRFLVVRDVAGRPVPGCAVTVVDRAQHRATLRTVASGRALLFPRAEGLEGTDLRATAECGRSTATAEFSLDAGDGLVDLRLPAARALPDRRTIDVAFVLDTTGSMGEEIAAIKSTIRKASELLERGNVSVRIGMVAYKDRGDEYVTRVYPMTTDFASFARDVADVSAGGGGDTPESVNEAVHVALTRLDWDPGAIGRYAFLVGDAPPHLDYAQDFDYAADAKSAAHAGIQIFTIAASGMDGLGQVVWRQIAQYTDARNLFVLRGGAGPQSTGAGDPQSSCGGTQTRYTSDNLDALIVANVQRETKALDGDPLRIAGLGKDEDAKPCGERLVAKD